MDRLTDEEIIRALEIEETNAVDSSTGELAKERADALDRYRGAPLGNEVEGRSQVVDRSIMDTIEWIMPSLTRIYLGGDEIGKFEPVGPEDEQAAQIETEVCNWYFNNKNDSFSQTQATLRDALLLKNGYMVAFWQVRKDTITEIYVGKTDEEVAMLMEDQDIKVVESTPKPDPIYGTVYDVKVEMVKADEYVQVESVPPDELIVGKRHRWTSLQDADFVEWVRRNVSIGQLRSEGFQIDDDESGYDAPSIEASSRDRFEQTGLSLHLQDNSPDPSRRLVTFRDAYYRIDLKGSGTPQLWRLARVEGSRKFTLREEANIIPFAAFSPLVYPHSHVGTSVYDLVADIGIVKTALQRQLLDGLYLMTSGKTGVDINKVVNLDDLLVSRPGQVVRFDGNPNEAMAPIPVNDASGAALSGLEYMEAQKEGRTGVTRYSAGLDANTLNKTATGVQAIQQAANQRIELIARTLASGFKDMFLIIHALASQHCTKELQIKLKGEWMKIDPRSWKKRTDFTISVGLGTGTPEQQLQKLMALTPVMQQSMALGLAGPTEAYNFGAEIWKAAGYKLTDRFIKPPQMVPKMDQNGQPVIDPTTGQPQMVPQQPPQQDDPIVAAQKVKSQADMQVAQMKSQFDAQQAQMKAQADAQVQQARAQADMAIQQHKIQTDANLEVEKTKMQLALEDVKHGREQQTQLQIANAEQQTQLQIAIIKAKAQVDAAQVVATKQAQAANEDDPEARM